MQEPSKKKLKSFFGGKPLTKLPLQPLPDQPPKKEQPKKREKKLRDKTERIAPEAVIEVKEQPLKLAHSEEVCQIDEKLSTEEDDHCVESRSGANKKREHSQERIIPTEVKITGGRMTEDEIRDARPYFIKE